MLSGLLQLIEYWSVSEFDGIAVRGFSFAPAIEDNQGVWYFFRHKMFGLVRGKGILRPLVYTSRLIFVPVLLGGCWLISNLAT